MFINLKKLLLLLLLLFYYFGRFFNINTPACRERGIVSIGIGFSNGMCISIIACSKGDKKKKKKKGVSPRCSNNDDDSYGL